MEFMELAKQRYSERYFDPRPVEEEKLQKILEAGRIVPTACNYQPQKFYVIRSEEAMAKLRKTTVFHYNAPVLIVTANRIGYGNAIADSACVLENMMIAANALGLGSCWINQLHWLSEHPAVRTQMERLGLGKEETITGGLILGNEPVRGEWKRTGNPVTWVED